MYEDDIVDVEFIGFVRFMEYRCGYEIRRVLIDLEIFILDVQEGGDFINNIDISWRS